VTWRRDNGARVRELEFRDYDGVKEAAEFIAEHVGTTTAIPTW
jgi:hypothetical protein